MSCTCPQALSQVLELLWCVETLSKADLHRDDMQVHPSVRVKMHTPPLTERCTLETNPRRANGSALNGPTTGGQGVFIVPDFGFHNHGGSPSSLDGLFHGKSIDKWMITRGRPILGNHQMGMELEVEFPSRMGW